MRPRNARSRLPLDGGKYVITTEAFDINTDVEGAIRAAFGNGATIADWQTLKGLLSTPTQLTKFVDQVGTLANLLTDHVTIFRVKWW